MGKFKRLRKTPTRLSFRFRPFAFAIDSLTLMLFPFASFHNHNHPNLALGSDYARFENV